MTRGVRTSAEVNSTHKRELAFMDPGETEYAWVTRTLGNCRFEVMTMNKESKNAKLRGNMKRRDWVTVGGLVLVSIRAFDENKVDIIVKYSETEVRALKKAREDIKDFDFVRGTFVGDVQGGDDIAFEEERDFEFDEI